MGILGSGLKIFVADTLNTIIGFIGLVYFANILNPSEIGVFFLFQTLLGLLSLFADVGLDDAIEKRLSEQNELQAHLTTGIFLKSITIATVCLSILLLHDYINEYLGLVLAAYLALGIILREGYNTAIKVLNGEHRVGETATLRLIYKSIWFGLGAFLLLNGYGVKGLVISLLVGYGIALLWGWHKISIPYSSPTITHARSLVSYSKYQFISRVGGEVYSWLDLFIIGFVLTQAAVGQYEVAWRITAIVIIFSTSISTALFPKVSYWFSEGKIGKIEKKIPELITLSTILVVPAFFGVLVFSREILTYTFGIEYAPAWLILVVLVSYKPFQAVQAILGRSLLAIDRPDLAAKATIISVLLNIFLNVLFVVKFGAIGAAVATVLSSLVSDILHYIYISRFITVRFQYKRISWILIASILMYLLLLVYNSRISVDGPLSLLAAISFGIGIYSVLVVIYKPIRVDLHKNITSIISAYRSSQS